MDRHLPADPALWEAVKSNVDASFGDGRFESPCRDFDDLAGAFYYHGRAGALWMIVRECCDASPRPSPAACIRMLPLDRLLEAARTSGKPGLPALASGYCASLPGFETEWLDKDALRKAEHPFKDTLFPEHSLAACLIEQRVAWIQRFLSLPAEARTAAGYPNLPDSVGAMSRAVEAIEIHSACPPPGGESKADSL